MAEKKKGKKKSKGLLGALSGHLSAPRMTGAGAVRDAKLLAAERKALGLDKKKKK